MLFRSLMFLIGNTLVTPNTSETILAGVTRDSVVQVAKHWGYNVEERKISVTEVVEAHNNGKLKEMFGTGTAATIAHIAMFHNNGTNYELPPVENRELSNKISAYLDELKRANVKDPFGWVTKV